MAGGNAPRVFQTAEGWFYLSTMLDNYGRRIIAWRPCSAMKAGDVTGRLTTALQATGRVRNCGAMWSTCVQPSQRRIFVDLVRLVAKREPRQRKRDELLR